MMDRSRWHTIPTGNGWVVMYDGGTGLEPWLEVRESSITQAGNGVFALRDFSEGETVAVYMGTVVPAQDKDGYMERAYSRAQEYERSGGKRGVKAAHEYVMQCGAVWIDGATAGSVARYINDSRTSKWVPNTRAKQGGQYGTDNTGDDRWGAAIITTSKVAAGAELFMSYGKDYWDWHDAKCGGQRSTDHSRTAMATQQRQASNKANMSTIAVRGKRGRGEQSCIGTNRPSRSTAETMATGEHPDSTEGMTWAVQPHNDKPPLEQPTAADGATHQDSQRGSNTQRPSDATAQQQHGTKDSTIGELAQALHETGDDASMQHNDTVHAAKRSRKDNACMQSSGQEKSESSSRAVKIVGQCSAAAGGWEKVRRARARTANADKTRAMKEARQTQRTVRQGGVRGTGRRKQSVNNGNGVEGENDGKRRRVMRQDGRDGTGAVPAAVT